ncbi:MAG: hypothetical protein M1834_000371 [Cirrosporium novae-zelandiae]|nr:MAG: hypothetical protein M1834_000371 [Cirrosporium novae-zelandiae]
MRYDWILDGGYLSQKLIRIGIRRQLAQRIASTESASLEEAYKQKMKYINTLRERPIAIETATANEQHYEVGTGVLQSCLGPRMKVVQNPCKAAYVMPTSIYDNYGWGSSALFFAEMFLKSQVTAFSNSKKQKGYIDRQAKAKGILNLNVVTGDVVDHDFPTESFDRVTSIELFGHMKNYELLTAKVSRVLKPDGKLFIHIFSHKDTPYDFEDGCMSKYFFTGGTMSSADLLYFQQDLKIEERWWISGKHYAKTCEDWLSKMTASKANIWPHLGETYGKQNAAIWLNRWQIFYMACAELFAYKGGNTWGVSHYLFEKA